MIYLLKFIKVYARQKKNNRKVEGIEKNKKRNENPVSVSRRLIKHPNEIMMREKCA